MVALMTAELEMVMSGHKAGQLRGEAPTWRDFLPLRHPVPQLITRAELLMKLAEVGIEVSERTLRFWEARGILPRPVRQSHAGVVQAVYPDWFPFIVQKVYRHRQEGLSLAAIAADIPRAIGDIAMLDVAYKNNILPLGEIPQGADLIPSLHELVRAVSDPERPIKRAYIVLVDDQGQLVGNLGWAVPSELLDLVEGPASALQVSIAGVNHATSDTSD